MKRRTRINYAPEPKAILWDRYKQGDSLHDIARMFDRYRIPSTIHQTASYVLRAKTAPISAFAWHKEEISRGLVAKLSIRDIATNLQERPQRLSREVQEHGGVRKQYRAAKDNAIAHWKIALNRKSLS